MPGQGLGFLGGNPRLEQKAYIGYPAGVEVDLALWHMLGDACCFKVLVQFSGRMAGYIQEWITYIIKRTFPATIKTPVGCKYYLTVTVCLIRTYILSWRKYLQYVP